MNSAVLDSAAKAAIFASGGGCHGSAAHPPAERRRLTADAGSDNKGGTRKTAGTSRQHPDEPPVGEMRPHLLLGQIGQAEPGQRRIEHQGAAVEHQLPFDPHPQLAPVLFRTPRRKARHGLAGAD